MKGIRPRFILWFLGLGILFLLANIQLRIFPHILIIFWALLPVLSLIYSLFSRSDLVLDITVSPSVLERDQKGDWICTLINQSRFMAFFLRFPTLKMKQGKNFVPLEIMIEPGETRSFTLPFSLHHTGSYAFQAKEPIFEDLLGFFWLSFTGRFNNVKSLTYALPTEENVLLSEQQNHIISPYQIPVDRKNITNASDEIFSVDPIVAGQSLAHAHWKLSARMQQWMIKNYSEQGQKPMRVIIDLPNIKEEPEVQFEGVYVESAQEDPSSQLYLRTVLLDYCYAILKSFMEHHSLIEITDRAGASLLSLASLQEIEELRLYLSQIPFRSEQTEWNIPVIKEKKQIIFVQEIDDITLGSLLQFNEFGAQFLVISFQAAQTKEIIEQLNQSLIDILWLDER